MTPVWSIHHKNLHLACNTDYKMRNEWWKKWRRSEHMECSNLYPSASAIRSPGSPTNRKGYYVVLRTSVDRLPSTCSSSPLPDFTIHLVFSRWFNHQENPFSWHFVPWTAMGWNPTSWNGNPLDKLASGPLEVCWNQLPIHLLWCQWACVWCGSLHMLYWFNEASHFICVQQILTYSDQKGVAAKTRTFSCPCGHATSSPLLWRNKAYHPASHILEWCKGYTKLGMRWHFFLETLFG